ncbi:pentapeptide repeat-containing protein [Bradyrhizobium barranii subsp. barranii]|uniref:Pentapeptide repeat-containing protein n=2 Tax=Bradyrhizobium barranii TaxID=2992140 RepID=A0A939M485_9BRAD|nr:pentapeptide repeat-containing protein [Bradyrhizobium barranii]UEM12389.1 pentapeptide repeat-containing protein [Bradyrhizobium barranii subsp. barranii]
MNAGVFPKLKDRRLEPVPIDFGLVRSRLGVSTGSSVTDCLLQQELIRQIGTRKCAPKPPTDPLKTPDLWSFLRQLDYGSGMVLVFDDFEELFGISQVEQAREFLRLLGCIVSNRVPPEHILAADRQLAAVEAGSKRQAELIELARGSVDIPVRVVICVQESFLPQVQQLQTFIPNVLKTSYRLQPFTQEEAESVILFSLQARNSGISKEDAVRFSKSAIKSIVDFLGARNERVTPDLTSNLQISRPVDPTELQILCQSIFHEALRRNRTPFLYSASLLARLYKRQRLIKTEDLRGETGMRRLLDRYYVQSLRLLPALRLGHNPQGWTPSLSNLLLFNLPRIAMARFCENGLILPNRRNTQVQEVAESQFGVNRSDLDTFVDRRFLVRRDARPGTFFYELASESLAEMLRRFLRRRRSLRNVMVLPLILTCVLLLQFLGWDIGTSEILLPRVPATLHSPIAKYISWRGRPVDLAFAGLAELSLRDVSFNGSKFTNAIMNGAILEGFQANQSMFTGANLESSIIDGSDFISAKLDKTKLSGATFNNSTLSKVNFANSSLKDIKFLSSNLYDSDFTQVISPTGEAPHKVVEFNNSNWWLSKGWDEAARWHFYRQFELRSYVGSVQYEKDYSTRCHNIRTGTTAVDRAAFVVTLAWFILVNGGDLEEAQSYIDQARTLGKDSGGKALDVELSASIEEYQAQMFLRKGNDKAARDLYEWLISGREWPVAAEWRYRYAIVLQHLGEKGAGDMKKSASKDFVFTPTYEQVLFEWDYPPTNNIGRTERCKLPPELESQRKR